MKEGLEFALAYLCKFSSPLKLCFSCHIRVTRLDGLEHQCLFDVAFAMKWVRPREMLFACSDGKLWGGFVLCVGG